MGCNHGPVRVRQGGSEDFVLVSAKTSTADRSTRSNAGPMIAHTASAGTIGLLWLMLLALGSLPFTPVLDNLALFDTKNV